MPRQERGHAVFLVRLSAVPPPRRGLHFAPCGAETYEGRCEGSVVTWCDWDQVWTRDCGIEQLECGLHGGLMTCIQPGGLPEPTLIAQGFFGAYAIAVDAESVYWTSIGGGSVAGPVYGSLMKASLAGGTATTLFESEQVGMLALALDDDDVFFTTQDHQFNELSGSGVRRMPKAGGTPTLLVGEHYGCNGLALTGDAVVFTLEGGGGVVRTLPKAGGEPTSLASDTQFPEGLAIDATNAYWVSNGDGEVLSVPLAGGTATVLASGLTNPRGMAIDDTYVYWVDSGTRRAADGAVLRVAKEGGEPTVLATGLLDPVAITLDASGVYVATFTGGSVLRIPEGGGDPEPLVVAQDGPSAIALDDTYVYWVTNGEWSASGAWRTPK